MPHSFMQMTQSEGAGIGHETRALVSVRMIIRAKSVAEKPMEFMEIRRRKKRNFKRQSFESKDHAIQHK